MKRILLSSVYKPFGVDNDEGLERIVDDLSGKFGHEGLFHIRTYWPNSNLHLIANNIEADTTVLEYPTREEFVETISAGDFDIIGISFYPPTYKKAFRMVDEIRKHSPKSRIILGGYGVSVPQVSELDDVTVCHGDGISFMRDLLGTPKTTKGNFRHPVLVEKYRFLGLPIRKRYQIVVDSGCDNFCEFCATSHFWKDKKVDFVSSADGIFDFVERISQENGNKTNYFFLNSTDFAKDSKRLERLADLVHASDINPRFFFLATAEDIEKTKIETLLRLGTETVWIGVESPSKSGRYGKTRGIDLKGLFDRLHRYGILTVGSATLFAPEHDRKSIRLDIDFMHQLGCTFSMFAMYTPMLDTPAYRKQEAAGNLLDIDWRYYNGFFPTFKHKVFSEEEMTRIRKEAEEYSLRTPSIFKAGLTKLGGYHNLKTEFPHLQKTIRTLERDIKMISLLIPVGLKFSKDTKLVREFESKMYDEFGTDLPRKIIGRCVEHYARLYKLVASGDSYYNQPRTVITRY